MQLQTFLLVSAALFLSEWRAVESYASLGEVPVENGKCIYNGTEITPGEPLKVEVPCEEWTCSARDGVTGQLSIAGCGTVGVGPDCHKVRGTGVYPHCCEQVVCN